MKFREFEEEARKAITSALAALGFPISVVEVSPPNDTSLGDLATAIPLKLSRQLQKPPHEIARMMSEFISRKVEKDLVASVEAHPSGYLNFMLDWPRFTHESIGEILASGAVGEVDVGEKGRVAIEHTNVNPNKALHVGHARNLVLGDSLARIMGHLGYAVQVLNYVDDSGAQVADVVVGFEFLGYSENPPAGMKFDAYCGDSIYTRVNQEYERDPSLKEKQRLVLLEIEKGEGKVSERARRIVDRILADQLKTCWRLGARYDLLNWESHILRAGMWEGVFEELKRRGIAKLETEGENAGCWVISGHGVGEEKVLVRSDGTTVYVAKDIPYAAWKIGAVSDPFRYEVYSGQPDKTLWTTTTGWGRPDHPRFGSAELAISVIDARQSNLQEIVAWVLAKLANVAESNRYRHRGYEVVALSRRLAESIGIKTEKEFVHMSGRKGAFINTDTVLDLLKKNAANETRKRNEGAPDDWVEQVAEGIAVSALRYELVKQDPDKMIVFDVQESLRLDGDTGPYLMYGYARARRILEKSDEKPLLTRRGAEGLVNPKERELIRQLSMFDKTLIEAAEFLSPKEVAHYSHRISLIFNEFYEAVNVNRESDRELRRARLALVDAFSRVLKECMRLLGLVALDKI